MSALLPPQQLTPSRQGDEIRGKLHYGSESSHVSGRTRRPCLNQGGLMLLFLFPSTSQEQWLWGASDWERKAEVLEWNPVLAPLRPLQIPRYSPDHELSNNPRDRNN